MALPWWPILSEPVQRLRHIRATGYANIPFITQTGLPMRHKLSAIILILSCLPVAAQEFGPRLQQLVQGNGVTIGGRAHVLRAAQGTYIEIENPRLANSVAGFIPFGDEPTFPGLSGIDGRNVEITGAVIMDGRAIIQMNDPNQLRVKDFWRGSGTHFPPEGG